MRGGWMGPTLLAMALLLIGLMALGGTSSDATGSVGSAERDGRLAGFLLLEDLGHAPELWLQPPGELPAGPHQVWLSAAPVFHAERDVELADDDPLAAARSSGPAGTLRYREFMEQGGTLVLPATERIALFLEAELELEPEPILAWQREQPGRLIETALEQRGFQTLAGTDVVEHYAGDELLATEVPVGAGSYVLIPAGDYLDNEHLGEGDNAFLLTHLAGRCAAGGRLLFDEHALGLAVGPTSTGLALSSQGLLLTVHLALLLLVLCWRAAWVREFPRDPAPLDRVSPLARVRSLADVLQRAGRIDLLAGMLRAGDGRGAPEQPLSGSAPKSNPATLAGLAALDVRLRTQEHSARDGGNH